MRFALKKESSARAKPGLRRGRCRILHLSNFTFVCYLEFGKFAHNLHYVDYERLPIEEFSENGGSIPHNTHPAFDIVLEMYQLFPFPPPWSETIEMRNVDIPSH